MQTSITQPRTPAIAEADAILRSCVHCGFCTATCPTYQLMGSELDSPRGRIYLIKEMLETGEATEKTRLHLDRCLTCRSCETTCPSGVRYGRLIDIGREIVEEKSPRTLIERLVRRTMLATIPYTARMSAALSAARLIRPLLPENLRGKLPERKKATAVKTATHTRRMLIAEGCVQPLTAPNTNAATAVVLDRLGISLVNATGCCGALNQHLSDSHGAKDMMRRNIDAWWPHIVDGAEAIVMTASGCGLMVKEYGALLKDDADYAEKASRISSIAKDISEILATENIEEFSHAGHGMRIAYHSSCTSQHGQKLSGKVEALLARCGFELTPVADSHLCCGAAGTYTLTQPELSGRLLANKLAALKDGKPEIIATANVGCQLHLASGTSLPVVHWIELLASSSKNHLKEETA
jgi:glycolate oxidase iron-sulfur subunit